MYEYGFIFYCNSEIFRYTRDYFPGLFLNCFFSILWYYPLASPSTHRSMLNCYHFLRLSTNVTTIDQAMVDGIPNGNDAKSSNLKESYIKVILMNEVGILDG
jgi:hypothetical protein